MIDLEKADQDCGGIGQRQNTIRTAHDKYTRQNTENGWPGIHWGWAGAVHRLHGFVARGTICNRTRNRICGSGNLQAYPSHRPLLV